MTKLKNHFYEFHTDKMQSFYKSSLDVFANVVQGKFMKLSQDLSEAAGFKDAEKHLHDLQVVHSFLPHSLAPLVNE